MQTRVAILHQDLMNTPGGAAAVCVWTIQALREAYHITLLTYGQRVDTRALNEFYGTDLREADFDVVYLETSTRISRVPWLRSFRSLQLAFAIRSAKRMADQFEVLISTANECDLGKRGVQYVHFPLRTWRALRGEYGVDRVWLRKVMTILFRIVSGTTDDRVRRNVTVANSEWTRGVIREVYGEDLEVHVVYPPVIFREKPRPWEQRENGFVCVGRLVEQKRILEIIGILENVRSRGHSVHLHIVGDGNGDYARQVRTVAEQRPWVVMEGWVPRVRLEQLMISHRYGIHGAPVEHFGMSVAEMVTAGCIVFVPSGGGQIEIVSSDMLVYHDHTDAVEKIANVLRYAHLQDRLRLDRCVERFSPQNFVSNIQRLVRYAEVISEGV